MNWILWTIYVSFQKNIFCRHCAPAVIMRKGCVWLVRNTSLAGVIIFHHFELQTPSPSLCVIKKSYNKQTIYKMKSRFSDFFGENYRFLSFSAKKCRKSCKSNDFQKINLLRWHEPKNIAVLEQVQRCKNILQDCKCFNSSSNSAKIFCYMTHVN